MRKKIGILFSLSGLFILVLAGCQRPTDFTFDNVHCTEARMETDINAEISGENLTIKVCVQCAGTPAEGATVEGHVVKTESFNPPEAVSDHYVFTSPVSAETGCTEKQISVSGVPPGDLTGQMFEATVKDIKGKVADKMTGEIRPADSQ